MNVLSMGTTNASEFWQKAMKQKVLPGLKGVKSIHDNLIVYARTREEHDQYLVALCKRLDELGLTVSRDNCKLGVEELYFFGFKISKDGITVGEDKVAALRDAGVPQTASEVRSFLGLARYCAHHLPHLADHAAPLSALTKDGVPFKWTSVEEAAFIKIKAALVT
jgi:hypothetical protein